MRKFVKEIIKKKSVTTNARLHVYARKDFSEMLMALVFAEF